MLAMLATIVSSFDSGCHSVPSASLVRYGLSGLVERHYVQVVAVMAKLAAV